MLRAVLRVRAPEGGLSGAGRVRMVRVRGLVFFVVVPVMVTALIVVFMGLTLAAKHDGLMTYIAAVRRARRLIQLTLACRVMATI